MMSKHPFDWICHAILCAIPVYFGWAAWFIVAFVGIYVEYIQKTQVWYNHFSWKEYFWEHSLGDLIADGFGIGIALFISKLILH